MATSAALGFVVGGDRKLRPIWRAILWVVLTVFVAMPLLGKLFDLIVGRNLRERSPSRPAICR